jgi:hypothetical protein
VIISNIPRKNFSSPKSYILTDRPMAPDKTHSHHSSVRVLLPHERGPRDKRSGSVALFCRLGVLIGQRRERLTLSESSVHQRLSRHRSDDAGRRRPVQARIRSERHIGRNRSSSRPPRRNFTTGKYCRQISKIFPT